METVKILEKKIVIVIVLFFINISIFAHPHMWFTSEVEFIFSDEKIKGAFVTWIFDSSFSADIIEGYDLDRNGKFNPVETIDVYDNAFTYTSNYSYFIFIRQGKDRSSPKYISKSTFSVHQKNGIISYRFFVDLNKIKGNEFVFACYDHTFFCDITYPKKKAVSFIFDSSKLNPRYTILENKEYPVYYNPISPLGDNRIYKSWKPGLNTYYPREIHVKF